MGLYATLRGIGAQAKTYPDAMKIIKEKNVDTKLFFDQDTFAKIFKRLNLRKQYPSSSEKLNIVDVCTSFSPFAYYMHQELNPKNHVLYPESPSAGAFWKQITDKDPLMRDVKVDLGQANKLLKHSFIRKALNEKWITPREQTDLSKINDTLLLVGTFMGFTGSRSLRVLLFFNQMKTSIFQFNNVKFLAWMQPSECLKFIGPMGSRHRRSNALMTNIFSDVKVIAYSNFSKYRPAERYLTKLYPDAIQLPAMTARKDACLVEFQSNYSKFDIKYPDELQVLIHKMLICPSNRVVDNLYTLGPGAEDYFKKHLSDDLLQKVLPYVTEEEFVKMSEVYYYWPFKPNTELEMFLGTPTPINEDD